MLQVAPGVAVATVTCAAVVPLLKPTTTSLPRREVDARDDEHAVLRVAHDRRARRELGMRVPQRRQRAQLRLDRVARDGERRALADRRRADALLASASPRPASGTCPAAPAGRRRSRSCPPRRRRAPPARRAGGRAGRTRAARAATSDCPVRPGCLRQDLLRRAAHVVVAEERRERRVDPVRRAEVVVVGEAVRDALRARMPRTRTRSRPAGTESRAPAAARGRARTRTGRRRRSASPRRRPGSRRCRPPARPRESSAPRARRTPR